MVKESTCQCMRCKIRRFQSLGQEDPLEEEMATHSSVLPWKIPWTEKPGGLQFVGSKRVGHNCVTNSLEKKMASHSNILPWKIPWTEKPGRLKSIGSQRVGYD